jgi:hypothetical protein
MRSVLEGDREGAIRQMFSSSKGKYTLTGDRVVVSTDLTAASDRIPHDLAIAIWEEILDIMRVSGVEREIVLDSLGP